MLRIGWFSTGRGEGSKGLLRAAMDAIQKGDLKAEIAFVFCNRERGEAEPTDRFFDLVQSYGLPLVTLSYSRYRRERNLPVVRLGEPLLPWRRNYDREVARLTEPYPFDLGMLAGFMLIFTDVICERRPLLNLHPAAPGGPVGIWQEVIWQLIDSRADRSGITIFLCTTALDRGPTVTYCTYPLRGPTLDPLWRQVEGRSLDEIKAAEGEENPLFKEIRRQGATRELPLIVATLRAFADDRLRFEGLSVVTADGHTIHGYDLTPEVEAAAVPLLAGSGA
jgi:folate-dependent phosphoribosylglycinamide formyltransferase PurN